MLGAATGADNLAKWRAKVRNLEAKKKAGTPLTPKDEADLRRWKRVMAANGQMGRRSAWLTAPSTAPSTGGRSAWLTAPSTAPSTLRSGEPKSATLRPRRRRGPR